MFSDPSGARSRQQGLHPNDTIASDVTKNSSRATDFLTIVLDETQAFQAATRAFVPSDRSWHGT